MCTLYVSDLDGTLLRSDEKTSEYTNFVINSLVAQGMYFSYATARSLITAKKATKGIEATIPLIVYNGAFVMDNITEKVLIANYFDDSVYEVLDDLNMEMDDVMEVTSHMMDYLRDRNDDMQIVTTVGGQQQEFFNGQDIFHMDEVKVLFLGMFKIRTISTIVALLSLGVLIATRAGSQTIFRCFQAGMGIFFGIAAVLGIIVASNFSKFFSKSHNSIKLLLCILILFFKFNKFHINTS